MNELDEIEEELKESEQKEHRKGKHKVSGRTVFKLKEIIKEKGEKGKQINGESDDRKK